MNKLGLASLDNLELTDATLTAGFWKPAEMMLRTYIVYSHLFGAVGSDVGRINEVTLRRAQSVLGWVTVSGFNSRCGQFISV